MKIVAVDPEIRDVFWRQVLAINFKANATFLNAALPPLLQSIM
jgi:hypothetical protein